MVKLRENARQFMNGAYINREYSWLEFDRRVLDQARDKDNPLLEKCKFLSIFKSNLDEFTMVRLGSLRNIEKSNPKDRDDKTEMTASEQIDGILSLYPALYKEADEVFISLNKELYKHGVDFLKPDEMSEKQRTQAKQYFDEFILPMVSPLVLDAKHPLIRFWNLRTYMVLLLEREGSMLFGVASMANSVERLFMIQGKKKHLVTAEDLLFAFGDEAFPGYRILDKALMRITRNADFDANMEDADMEYNFDFSKFIKTKVEERTNLECIRVEMNRESEQIRSYISKQIGVRKANFFISKTYFDYKFLFKIGKYFSEKDARNLKFPDFKGHISDRLKSSDLISEVEKKDIFLSYPYDSIDTLIRLLNQCAVDESVTSIKITIYRLADHSKIVDALIKAAENGKEVIAVMELCARFDEENNLYYADMLREAGCTVFYGIENYKVHSKIISIVREKDKKVKYITHLGTGNYNESTSKQYTDLNIITANEEIGRDGVEFFRNIAVRNVDYEYRKLLIAPHTLKSGLIKEIEKEIAKGPEGVIKAKFNSLTDKAFIDKFIEASQKGVKISLVVRGICCMLPKVPGLTDNISVISIVGRFLEHSRIYAFGKGDDQRVYISSADLMTRNVNRRIEIATPVLDEEVKEKVLTLLDLILSDNIKGRSLGSDGSYSKIKGGEKKINSQEICLARSQI